MLDTKIDTTPYKDAIILAENAIVNVGRTMPHSYYKEACEEVLSNLYLSLENLGISDRLLMYIAADFIDIISANKPLSLAA